MTSRQFVVLTIEILDIHSGQSLVETPPNSSHVHLVTVAVALNSYKYKHIKS